MSVDSVARWKPSIPKFHFSASKLFVWCSAAAVGFAVFRTQGSVSSGCFWSGVFLCCLGWLHQAWDLSGLNLQPRSPQDRWRKIAITWRVGIVSLLSFLPFLLHQFSWFAETISDWSYDLMYRYWSELHNAVPSRVFESKLVDSIEFWDVESYLFVDMISAIWLISILVALQATMLRGKAKNAAEPRLKHFILSGLHAMLAICSVLLLIGVASYALFVFQLVLVGCRAIGAAHRNTMELGEWRYSSEYDSEASSIAAMCLLGIAVIAAMRCTMEATKTSTKFGIPLIVATSTLALTASGLLYWISMSFPALEPDLYEGLVIQWSESSGLIWAFALMAIILVAVVRIFSCGVDYSGAMSWSDGKRYYCEGWLTLLLLSMPFWFESQIDEVLNALIHIHEILSSLNGVWALAETVGNWFAFNCTSSAQNALQLGIAAMFLLRCLRWKTPERPIGSFCFVNSATNVLPTLALLLCGPIFVCGFAMYSLFLTGIGN